MDTVIKYFLNNRSLIRLYGQIVDFMSTIVFLPGFNKLIPIRAASTAEEPLHRQLSHASFDALRSFQALAGGLLVANVVNEFICMALKSLLAFRDAPDFHIIYRKIFHEERSFRISPSKIFIVIIFFIVIHLFRSIYNLAINNGIQTVCKNFHGISVINGYVCILPWFDTAYT